jgi:hypothetical protein
MTDARFDPKHDARYQRGYEPGAPADADTAALTERFAPTTESQPTASLGSTETGSVPEPGAVELLDQFEPRNPFIIALWFIGPSLFIGGLTLQVQVFLDSFFRNNSGIMQDDAPFDIIQQEIAFILAPTMTTTGLATMVGLLFFSALRWRARSTRR